MQYFNGKAWIEPSVGSKIVTNVAPSANLISTGTVAVLGESEGGLTWADGVMYASTQPNFLKSILRSGIGYRCINYIFNPSLQYPGASKVIFVRTQVATVATATISQDTQGAVATLVLTTKDKGSYLSDVTNGLKWKLIAGTVNATYEVLILQLNGTTIWTSPECDTYRNLMDAILNNDYVNSILSISLTVGTADMAISTSARTSSFAVFTGGTKTSMTGTDVDGALALLTTQKINYIFIADTTNTNHAKVLSFANNTAEHTPICFFGGVSNESITTTLVRSAALNAENAVLCYPDILMPTEDGTSTEYLSPMYFAAICVGLRAGLPPFMPLTYKTVNVLGFRAAGGDLSKDFREQLINGGVLYGRNIEGIGFAINKGINTLQSNGSMIYKKTDGSATSPEISIIAIMHTLNEELILNATKLFIGGTVATVTKEDVSNFTKEYLRKRCSTPTEPNLLITFENVNVELVDDAWYVYYGFTPNTPINFVFYTGAMLKP